MWLTCWVRPLQHQDIIPENVGTSRVLFMLSLWPGSGGLKQLLLKGWSWNQWDNILPPSGTITVQDSSRHKEGMNATAASYTHFIEKFTVFLCTHHIPENGFCEVSTQKALPKQKVLGITLFPSYANSRNWGAYWTEDKFHYLRNKTKVYAQNQARIFNKEGVFQVQHYPGTVPQATLGGMRSCWRNRFNVNSVLSP